MKRTTQQSLLLVLFLIVFPAISWLYLRYGMDYRIEALSKLEDHGKVSSYTTIAENGDTLYFEDIRGKVVVASFFGFAQDSLVNAYGDRLQKLNGQFGGRPEVLFLQHVVATDNAMRETVDFQARFDLLDGEKVQFVFPEPEQARELVTNIYHLPGVGGMADISSNPMIALVDTTHTIRRYYDVRDDDSMRELVEHLAIVIPPVKDRDLVFKREKEK